MVNSYSLFSVSSALSLRWVSFIFPGVSFRLSTSQQFSHSWHPTPTCSPPPFYKQALFTQRRRKIRYGIEVVSRKEEDRTPAHSRPEGVDNKLNDSGHKYCATTYKPIQEPQILFLLEFIVTAA
jgi:hypothetical protein